MNNYWVIELWSGELIKVKPQNAPTIQNEIEKREYAITTPTRSIIIKDIKDFRVSETPYIDTPMEELTEGASQAFKEEILSKDGSVQATWVKKTVPRRRYDTYYRAIPSYQKLSEDDSSVVIVFRLPTHQMDRTYVTKLTNEEAMRMERLRTI